MKVLHSTVFLSFRANLDVHVNNFLITFEFLFRVGD